MLYIVLLISLVSCEWVEISQNYKRINSFRKGSTKTGNTGVDIYTNTSIPDLQWNKAIDRTVDAGHIKQNPFLNTKSPVQERYNNKNAGSQIDVNIPIGNRESYFTPVKSDSLENYPRKEVNQLKSSEMQFDDKIKNIITTTVKNEREFGHESFSTNDEQYKWVYVRTESPKLEKQNALQTKIEKINISRKSDNFNIKEKYEYIYNHTKNQEDLRLKELIDEVIVNDGNKNHEYDDRKVKNDNVFISNLGVRNSVKSNSNFVENKRKVIESVTQIHSDTNIEKDEFKTETHNHSFVHEDLSEVPVKFSDKIDNNKRSKVKQEMNTNTIDKNSLERMLKIVKNIVDTISRNTKQGLKGKIDYLEDLKTTILSAIEDRVDQVWPDDTPQSLRHSRSANGRGSPQARGHVEFPSSESALMTISFLTFAVFLIKLVLQVIHAYKSKAMMVTPAVVAAVGRAASAFTNKN